jgi:hypothetical protein
MCFFVSRFAELVSNFRFFVCSWIQLDHHVQVCSVRYFVVLFLRFKVIRYWRFPCDWQSTRSLMCNCGKEKSCFEKENNLNLKLLVQRSSKSGFKSSSCHW